MSRITIFLQLALPRWKSGIIVESLTVTSPLFTECLVRIPDDISSAFLPSMLELRLRIIHVDVFRPRCHSPILLQHTVGGPWNGFHRPNSGSQT